MAKQKQDHTAPDHELPEPCTRLVTPDMLAEEEEEATYVLLPIIGEHGAYMAVFADGSYTRWIPGEWHADAP